VLEWVAAVHVHTRYSDGTGEMTEVLSAARDAGIDVLVSTDHDNLNARRECGEGWRDGVLHVAGAEITPSGKPHCVAYGVGHCCGFSQMTEQEYLAAVDAQGGFAMVAHPQGLALPTFGIRQRAWTQWRHPVVRGFELWSYLHDWIDDLRGWRLLKAGAFWRHPERMITGPNPKLLQLWDRVTQERRLSAVSGLDCHARKIDLLNVVIFPYRQMFETIRTHLLIDEQTNDASDVSRARDAMAEGRCFVAYDGLADARGLRAWAELTDGSMAQMGEERIFDGPARLRFEAPHEAEITLVGNGETRMSRTARKVEFVAEQPGVYRFEAELNGKPWVYANPFYLR